VKMKLNIINMKGVAVFIIILLVIQVAFGLLISPAVGSLIIDSINKSGGSKVSVDKIHVWPLTLSISLKGLKIFDPDGKERIVMIDKASARLSFIGLLSKRLVISRINVNGAEIDLKGEPDGSFNVEKIVKPVEAPSGEKASGGSVFDRFRKGKDWFSRLYDILKKRGSEKGVEEARQERLEARKVSREIVELPRGRRVLFQTVRSGYLVEIQGISMKNVNIHAQTDDKRSADLVNAAVKIHGIAIDPEKGAKVDGIAVKSDIEKDGTHAGRVKLSYEQGFKGDDLKTRIDISADKLDLAAVSFIYEDSIPVTVKKGMIDFRSGTTIINDTIDSSDSLSLSGHELEAKSGSQTISGFVPMPVLCDALNQVDTVNLQFSITGTLAQPRFSGLQESLMETAKPYMADMAQGIKEKGLNAIKDIFQKESGDASGGTEASTGEETQDAGQQAVDTLKSLFKK